MAFTRAPVNDTHNVQRLPVSGQAFVVSNNVGAGEPETLNYLDCFTLSESQWGTNPRKTVQKRESWVRSVVTGSVTSTGAFLSRGGVVSPDQVSYDTYYFGKGGSFYAYDYVLETVNPVMTPATATPYQSNGTAALDNSNVLKICFLDAAGYLCTFSLDGTGDTETNLGALTLDGGKNLVFLNSYLFAVNAAGNKIYNSTVGGVLTTWASTDFISAEQYADPVQWIDKHKNYLVAFGTQSIEFFYDGGVEVGSPLVRQESYSRQIGIFTDSTSNNDGKYTAHIDDDIYFLGTRGNDTIGLFRIRNFQVEEIDSQYFQNVANRISGLTANVTRGLETITVNNNPMILININNENYGMVYFPKEDSWWQLRYGDPTLVDFPAPEYRIGVGFYSPKTGTTYFLSANSTAATSIYMHTPDLEHTQSVTSTIYTEVVDFGINYWKHIARVDAIGDFGDNTVTLYYNGTPNYEDGYTACSPVKAIGTQGYGNNASWYNLGAYRRMSFKITIAGYKHAVYEGLDIEYNAGAA